MTCPVCGEVMVSNSCGCGHVIKEIKEHNRRCSWKGCDKAGAISNSIHGGTNSFRATT